MNKPFDDPFDADQKTAGAEMKRIRQEARLSITELAELLRIRNPTDLRQMERGKRPISGPIRLVLEAVADGRIDPDQELTSFAESD